MFRMRIRDDRQPVNIRVAFDTILYAPIYTFVQRHSQNGRSDFRFHIIPVRSSIEPKLGGDLSALAPIQKDPVFTTVIKKVHFRTEQHKYDWFGIGDPLRVRRLIQLRNDPHSFSYDFVGTLIDKLAFWIVTESHCDFKEANLWQYNYVACQSVGMTGYYLAETLFKTDRSNPLAPSRTPGREVHHMFKLLEVDMNRRATIKTGSNPDPVWFAAVSTEIDKILYLTRKYDSDWSLHFDSINLAFQKNEEKKIDHDFLLTAIVARRYDRDEEQQKKLMKAEEILIEGVTEEIGRLQSADNKIRKEFLSDLVDFYWSCGSFSLPGSSQLLRFGHDLHDVLDSIKDIYPSSLVAPLKAKTETDKFLRRAIRSELERNGDQVSEIKVNAHFDDLCTDSWQARCNQLWKCP